jgi:hypothetical protein
MNDIRPALAALLGHLNQHPELAATIMRASVNNDVLDIHASAAHHEQPHLPILATWLDTIDNVTHVQVCALTEYTHLAASGTLANTDVPVKVKVLLDDTEADLLAAHTPVEVDATFPVELLRTLAAAEQVAR